MCLFFFFIKTYLYTRTHREHMYLYIFFFLSTETNALHVLVRRYLRGARFSRRTKIIRTSGAYKAAFQCSGGLFYESRIQYIMDKCVYMCVAVWFKTIFVPSESMRLLYYHIIASTIGRPSVRTFYALNVCAEQKFFRTYT